MGYQCYIGPLDLLDGGLTTLLHIARVSHQLEPYVSKLPGLSPRGLGSVWFGLGVWMTIGVGEEMLLCPSGAVW